MADYAFLTRWRVAATPEEVYAILDDALDLPRWWPAVYLSAREVAPGDSSGIGKIVSLHTKGWLPYTLTWEFRVTEKRRPHGFALEATGDFVGRGVWEFTGDGSMCDVTFDWRIRADKPLLRYLSFLLRPIFAWNHRWAMAKGEESLNLELHRRRAPDAASAANLPHPPGPTFYRKGA
jgi:hypothetical protein